VVDSDEVDEGSEEVHHFGLIYDDASVNQAMEICRYNCCSQNLCPSGCIFFGPVIFHGFGLKWSFYTPC